MVLGQSIEGGLGKKRAAFPSPDVCVIESN